MSESVLLTAVRSSVSLPSGRLVEGRRPSHRTPLLIEGRRQEPLARSTLRFRSSTDRQSVDTRHRQTTTLV